MTSEIIGYSKSDGWALIDINSLRFAVYPPYRFSFENPLSETQVQNAFKLGFEKTSLKFSNKNDLFGYLIKEYESKINKSSLSIPNEKLFDSFLKNAKKENILFYFDYIENNLLPNNEIQIATKLRNKLAHHITIEQNKDLHERSLKLLSILSTHSFNKFAVLSKSINAEFLENLDNYECDRILTPCE